MNKNQLRQTLNDLSLQQTEFAKLLGVTSRAVTLWLAGERSVPSPVISYLRLFSILPQNLRQAELTIANNKEKKMREGMYGFTFQSDNGYGNGILLFENGRICGVDSASVKYDGSYTYSFASETVTAIIKITFPPHAKSVFGVTNPYEWSFDLTAEFNPNSNSGAVAVRTSLGAEISAQYTYLRTLPEAA